MKSFLWQCCGRGVGNILFRITWRGLKQSFRNYVKTWDLITRNTWKHMKKKESAKMRTRKEDKQIFRTVRVKGTFPRSLRFTEKPDLLFPLTFDLSFMQQVKRVRPRTATDMLERRTWNKYSFLLSHVPHWPISPPPTLKHSGTSSAFNLLHLQPKKKVRTDAFGMRKLPDHLFHNPDWHQPGSSEFRLLPLATPYTIFKLFLRCSHKHSQVTSKNLLLLQLTKQGTIDEL